VLTVSKFLRIACGSRLKAKQGLRIEIGLAVMATTFDVCFAPILLKTPLLKPKEIDAFPRRVGVDDALQSTAGRQIAAGHEPDARLAQLASERCGRKTNLILDAG
jgi:hypothetical protein